MGRTSVEGCGIPPFPQRIKKQVLRLRCASLRRMGHGEFCTSGMKTCSFTPTTKERSSGTLVSEGWGTLWILVGEVVGRPADFRVITCVIVSQFRTCPRIRKVCACHGSPPAKAVLLMV